MVNRIVILLLAGILSGIQSCKVSDEIVPDINTILSKTFQIRIYDNSDITPKQVVDISSTDEYNDFKDLLDGFELTKITYRIKNDNVPDDMYFSGEIICSNDEGNMDSKVGNISRIKISDAADANKEFDVAEDMTDVNKVLGWLENPGNFMLSLSYQLTNDQNIPYEIGQKVIGSNFEVIIRFYLKVKTSI